VLLAITSKLYLPVHGDVLEMVLEPVPTCPYYPQDIHWIGIEPIVYALVPQEKQIGSV